MSSAEKNKFRPETEKEAIEATAGAWLSLRDRGMTPQETEAFVRWLQQDARHARTFEVLDETWREFDQLSAIVRPGSVTNPETLVPRYRRRFAKLPLVALSAAAAMVILCFALWRGMAPRYFAETAVGAFQKVDLPDGSVAQMNTDSAIETDMDGVERRVRIVRGEVHFAVHKDATHPFIVSVGNIQVHAVGTAFDVRSRSSGVEVIVTEGRVQLWEAGEGRSLLPENPETKETTPLVAGEKALIAVPDKKQGAGAIHVNVSTLSGADVRRALAWQERRLEFDETPLSEVAAEFNRYNRVKLVVNDARLAQRTFTGTFRADGYEALVSLLEENFGVAVTRDRGEIWLAEK